MSSVPAVGCISVVSIFMVVDLPAPLDPKKPKACPVSTDRSMPFTAVLSPV